MTLLKSDFKYYEKYEKLGFLPFHKVIEDIMIDHKNHLRKNSLCFVVNDRVNKITARKVIGELFENKFEILDIRSSKDPIVGRTVAAKRKISFVRHRKKVVVEFKENIKDVLQYMEGYLNDSKEI